MAERPSDPKSLDLGKQFDPKKFKVEIKTTEHPTEMDHRLRKEFLSFVVKDLSTYGIAILIVLVALIYCFSVLVLRSSSSEEKAWAMSVLTSILTGAIGFAFGKTTSK
jgi:hypothetical protein